jgi:Lrp/AsnC family transcriptional regulator
MITLDRIDREILKRLQCDGDMSMSELAEQLSMSGPPCWRRVKRLRDAGVLTHRSWHVDPESVDLNVVVFATLSLTAHDVASISAFREKIRDIPAVLECYILLGGIDVLVKIMAKDIKSYEELYYSTLSQLPGVRATTSSVVMSTVKKIDALPIPLLPPDLR